MIDHTNKFVYIRSVRFIYFPSVRLGYNLTRIEVFFETTGALGLKMEDAVETCIGEK